MDPRERLKDPIDAVKSALINWQSGIWTALPAVIQDFNQQGDGTCTAQPTIQVVQKNPDETLDVVNLPQLLNVPVLFPRGGSFVLTFPINPGDEALIIFASRCIDDWWIGGWTGKEIRGTNRNNNRLPVYRLHGMSDGFAIVGPYSRPNIIPNISPDRAQLRSKDGSCYIEIAPDNSIGIVAPGGIRIQGLLTSDSEGSFNNHTVGSHTHPGVQTGTGVTGGPVG
jgi:hypothetical protein